MKISEGMFAIKLYELERQYGRMQSRLRLCREEDHEKIRQELEAIYDEFRETELLLEKSVESCRSPAVAALSRAQQEYYRTIRLLLEKEIPKLMHCEATLPSEDEVEGVALYAEYAMDFAVQSMRYALIAALRAIDLEMSTEEEGEHKDE